MISKLTKLASAIALAAAVSVPAQATPITGTIEFAGGARLTGGSNLFNSTGIDFGTTFVTGGDGAYGSVAPGTSLSMNDISNFNSFSGPLALWSFSTVAGTYSFSLETLAVDMHDATHLNLSGLGTLTAPGLEDTKGLFDFSTQSSTGKSRVSFSADNSASAVPEPMSLGLLGTGLVMLAARGKKAAAKAA